MRNSFLLFFFLLAGCAGAVVTSSSSPQSKQSRNEKCLESSKMKVFQVGDKSILAHLCPTTFQAYYTDAFDACSVHGDIVYLPVPINNDYVDDQKVSLTEDKCFIADGTYKYQTQAGLAKTVRKIKIIDSMTPNTGPLSDKQ